MAIEGCSSRSNPAMAGKPCTAWQYLEEQKRSLEKSSTELRIHGASRARRHVRLVRSHEPQFSRELADTSSRDDCACLTDHGGASVALECQWLAYRGCCRNARVRAARCLRAGTHRTLRSWRANQASRDWPGYRAVEATQPGGGRPHHNGTSWQIREGWTITASGSDTDTERGITSAGTRRSAVCFTRRVSMTYFFASSWRCSSTGSFSRTIAVLIADRHVLV
jgi:hypothetical protein